MLIFSLSLALLVAYWLFGVRPIVVLARRLRAGTSQVSARQRGNLLAPAGAPVCGPAAPPGGLEARVVADHLTIDGLPCPVIAVEIRGELSLPAAKGVGILTTLVDLGREGEGEAIPVLCTYDEQHDPRTFVFANRATAGVLPARTRILEWRRVASIMPGSLIAGHKGVCQLRATVSCHLESAPPRVERGNIVGGDEVGRCTVEFGYDMPNEGYREAAERRHRMDALTVHLAVAVAFADGDAHVDELATITRWCQAKLELERGDDRASRLADLDAELGKARGLAQHGGLDLATVLAEMKDVADMAARMAALELCMRVMSADRRAATEELDLLNRIAQVLGVDTRRFVDLKDKHIAGLAADEGDATDFHVLLDIDRSWNRERVRKHLTRLYAQWNSRAENQEDPAKRADAERMLETIARARLALVEQETP